jgi:hypothetical protein
MTKLTEMIGAVLIISVPVFVITNCQKQESSAERIGQNLDKALVSVGERLELTADHMKDIPNNKHK